jgi:hypothetical protein
VPQESVDVSAIMVKFSLPLRNVSLREALDAVAKVAERNIEYTVEDYGVVISLKPVVTVGGQLSNVPATPEPEPLVAFTFKVDTNTFLVGLETAFDIKVAQPPTAKERAREIQSALKALLGQLGVGGKSIFYNELTGIIMVRASASDHSVIQAAMETLGGTPVGSYGATGLSGVYGVTLQGGGGR